METKKVRFYRWVIYCMIVAIFFATSVCRVFAANGGWEERSSGIDKTLRLSCVEGAERTDTLYAGTSDGVYRTVDLGKHWVRVSLAGKETGITRVAFSGDTVYISTESGLYKRRGGEWNWSPGKQYLYGVASGVAGGDETVLIWSETEIFLIEADGWKRIDPRTSGEKLEDVAIKDGIIYAAAGNKLFYSRDRGNAWDRYFVSRGVGEEMVHADDEETRAVYSAIRRIDSSGPFGVTVTTGEGIFLFRDGARSVERINTTGLPSSRVMYALNIKEGLFAATGTKVFLRVQAEPRGAWRTVFENSATGNIVWLKVLGDVHGEEWLWVVTEKSIYRKSIDDIIRGNGPAWKPEKTVTGFHEGPTILDVQRMAIEYAEVSPEKIKRWRIGAKWKAIMPRLSVNFSRSDDDNIEIYKNSTTSYVVRGPREVDNDWGVALTWDLADVIWSNAQTTIDIRSKLMVQLRDNILEEVTRLYLERKRLLVGMQVDMARGEEHGPKKIREKRIRVDELTAYIDAFTGGGFSATMNEKGSI